MKRIKILTIISILLLSFFGCAKKENTERIKMLKQKISQFAPVEISYDKSLLNKRQKIVLEKLYEAAKLIDEIYLGQVYSKNYEIRQVLLQSNSLEDKLALEYFDIMFGPFDRLEHNKPFIDSYQKPLGANFYPEDMTKQEFESWIKTHPEDEKSFTSEYTVIRRQDSSLVAIPYSQFYKDKLKKISFLLKEAAKYADNPSLRKYLNSRADAFLSNDYFQSDMDWMDLKNHTIEPVIGPFEVYEDELFNYKASFEAFLTLVDPKESAKLKIFAKYLKEMEANLPLPDKFKNFNRGSDSPIIVAQEVYCAGDAKAGVQTLAFNLPNDERVRKAKGSKKVLLKNIHEAKFKKLLFPIAERVLDENDLNYVTFEAFFNHTLMHEISHGLGPGIIYKNGRKTEVKKELKENYATLEECKADVLGMLNNIFMIKKGIFPKSFEKDIWNTFLAGIFRSVRFGVREAHGGGNAIIFNYLLENGGYEYDQGLNKVRVNYDKVYDNLKALAHDILIIQATGNYRMAKDMIDSYAHLSEPMKNIIKTLTDLPVDIKPIFQIEKEQ